MSKGLLVPLDGCIEEHMPNDASRLNLDPAVIDRTLVSFMTSGVTDASWDAFVREIAAAPGDKSGTLPLAILADTGDACILQLASTQMLLTGAQADGGYVLDSSDSLAFLAACLER